MLPSIAGSSTVLLLNLSTYNMDAIAKFFRSKADPEADILGIRLTRTSGTMLVDECKAITGLLAKQKSDVQQLLDSSHHTSSLNLLTALQERHAQIDIQVQHLIDQVQCSRTPWLKEFVDARVSMGSKIMMCNRASNPFTLGWKAAAVKYWPWISQTYDMLLSLLDRLDVELKKALQDNTLWDAEARKRAHRASIRTSVIWPSRKLSVGGNGKKISFSDYVAVRDLPRSEPGVDGGHVGFLGQKLQNQRTALLTDDRKRTVEKYKGGKVLSRK